MSPPLRDGWDFLMQEPGGGIRSAGVVPPAAVLHESQGSCLGRMNLFLGGWREGVGESQGT